MQIPTKRVVEREEFMISTVVLPQDRKLKVYSGQRHLSLKLRDLEAYIGERGRRGNKLPRGFQNVSRMTIE